MPTLRSAHSRVVFPGSYFGLLDEVETFTKTRFAPDARGIRRAGAESDEVALRDVTREET